MMVDRGDGNVPVRMPSGELASGLGGGLSAQFRVRPDMVVIVLPRIEHQAGMGASDQQQSHTITGRHTGDPKRTVSN